MKVSVRFEGLRTSDGMFGFTPDTFIRKGSLDGALVEGGRSPY